MQDQTSIKLVRALDEIARELKAIRKLMEKNNVPIPTIFKDDKPWMKWNETDVECLSNNPEEHGWCQDEQG